MPPPIKVELLPYDPRWASAAATASQALATTIGACLLECHHVGSTAIPGIHAKPILDLMPVVTDLAALDSRQNEVQALGYEWWGEYGLQGRRYCTLSDPQSGLRLIHVHCYAQGSPEITRHLAFRDYLRSNGDVARDYDREKRRCQILNPFDSHAYGDCKAEWIATTQARALAVCSDD